MSRCGARAVAAVTLNRSYRRSAVAVPCDGRCRATSYHWSGRRGWADDNSRRDPRSARRRRRWGATHRVRIMLESQRLAAAHVDRCRGGSRHCRRSRASMRSASGAPLLVHSGTRTRDLFILSAPRRAEPPKQAWNKGKVCCGRKLCVYVHDLRLYRQGQIHRQTRALKKGARCGTKLGRRSPAGAVSMGPSAFDRRNSAVRSSVRSHRIVRSQPSEPRRHHRRPEARR
jgi:hypothetical protein